MCCIVPPPPPPPHPPINQCAELANKRITDSFCDLINIALYQCWAIWPIQEMRALTSLSSRVYPLIMLFAFWWVSFFFLFRQILDLPGKVYKALKEVWEWKSWYKESLSLLFSALLPAAIAFLKKLYAKAKSQAKYKRLLFPWNNNSLLEVFEERWEFQTTLGTAPQHFPSVSLSLLVHMFVF